MRPGRRPPGHGLPDQVGQRQVVIARPVLHRQMLAEPQSVRQRLDAILVKVCGKSLKLRKLFSFAAGDLPQAIGHHLLRVGQQILTLDRLLAEVRFSGFEQGFGREVAFVGRKQPVGNVHVGNAGDGSRDVFIEERYRHQCPFDRSHVQFRRAGATDIERTEHHRTALRHVLPGLLELERTGFVVVMPDPAVSIFVEAHAPKFAEAGFQPPTIADEVVQAGGLKRFARRCCQQRSIRHYRLLPCMKTWGHTHAPHELLPKTPVVVKKM